MYFWILLKRSLVVLRKVERNTGQEEDALKVENEPRRKDPPRTQFSWFHGLASLQAQLLLSTDLLWVRDAGIYST